MYRFIYKLDDVFVSVYYSGFILFKHKVENMLWHWPFIDRYNGFRCCFFFFQHCRIRITNVEQSEMEDKMTPCIYYRLRTLNSRIYAEAFPSTLLVQRKPAACARTRPLDVIAKRKAFHDDGFDVFFIHRKIQSSADFHQLLIEFCSHSSQ